MGDNIKQYSYLMGLINVTNVVRRRHGTYEEPESSRRQATVFFTLPDGKGNVVQVCKKTFLDVHGITKRTVETLVKAKKKGDFVYVEKRGNKKKNRKYSPEDEKSVVDHVNSFPKQKSHYTRAKNDRDYLSEDLNFNRMYLAFKEIYPESEIKPRYYKDTVKRRFPNLKFQKPRKDTCGTCDLLKSKLVNESSSSSNKDKNKNTLELHHRQAERARLEMKSDTEKSQHPNSKMCTISVDLQQVFSLPTLTHSQMYYLRQLSCYNFGIHLGDYNKGFMFVWHEGLSGRGGNEIASCLLKFLQSRFTNKKNLVIWSDNCTGQNKNQMLLFLWIYLVLNGVFDEIDHKYLVSGHSYLSCDRDFAQIEKKKKVTKCEVPLDIVRLLVSTCHKNPFMATLMQEEDFFYFKSAAKSFLNTKKLEIKKVHWIRITKENPGVISTKKTFNEIEPWSQTKVLRKGVKLEDLKQLPEHLNPINNMKKEKKDDLKTMIPFLKEENKDFYRKLTV